MPPRLRISWYGKCRIGYPARRCQSGDTESPGIPPDPSRSPDPCPGIPAGSRPRGSPHRRNDRPTADRSPAAGSKPGQDGRHSGFSRMRSVPARRSGRSPRPRMRRGFPPDRFVRQREAPPSAECRGGRAAIGSDSGRDGVFRSCGKCKNNSYICIPFDRKDHAESQEQNPDQQPPGLV